MTCDTTSKHCDTEDLDNPDLILGDDGLLRPAWAMANPLMLDYYDNEWGMQIRDERGMFERLCLEAFQSGLSWETILRKRPAFRSAFDDFDPDIVADYDDRDVERLMNDKGIIRNRRKILATVANANATVALRKQGGLASFIWSFRPEYALRPYRLADIPCISPESTALSKALKKAGFSFVGPTTMFSLMEATGIIDTHLVGSYNRGVSEMAI